MYEVPVWEVTLIVSGSITVEKLLSLKMPKSFQQDNPFYSDIKIKRNKTFSGVEATVTAYAATQQLAREAGITFFGQMLDALAIKIEQPLYLHLSDNQHNQFITHSTLRRVKEEEWVEAFEESRYLGLNEPIFLRALSWYRKGLYTEDPLDKFLALWNAIEVVASKYHPTLPEGKANGTKNYIWESFKLLWGECENWPIIQGQEKWIHDNYDIRISIAHGTKSIDIETVKEVVQKINILRQVAHKFLLGWREKI